jgi:hypothetical protein
MSRHVPSLGDVRNSYTNGESFMDFSKRRDRSEGEFDRFIEKVRAEAKVEALQEAAGAYFTEHENRSSYFGVHFTREWLKARAARVKEVSGSAFIHRG